MATVLDSWVKGGIQTVTYGEFNLPIHYYISRQRITEIPDWYDGTTHYYRPICVLNAWLADSDMPTPGLKYPENTDFDNPQQSPAGYCYRTVYYEKRSHLIYVEVERYSIQFDIMVTDENGNFILSSDAEWSPVNTDALLYNDPQFPVAAEGNSHLFPSFNYKLRVKLRHHITRGSTDVLDEIVLFNEYDIGTAPGAPIDISKPSLTGLTFGYQLSNIHQYLDGEDDLRLYYGATFGHPTWKTGDYYQNRAIIRVGQNRQEQFVSAQEGWLQTDEGETTTISRNIVCDDDVPPTLSICNIDLTVVANTGQETRQKVYARRPCCVTGVTVQPPSSMLPGDTQQLYWSVQGESGLTPDNTSVTITSSAPSVVSVDSNGMLTAQSNLGVAIITVESNDYTEIAGHKYNHHYAQVTVYNTSSNKPEFADSYDYLSASLAQNIAAAIIYLAQEAGITIPGLYSLNGYATPIKDIRKILDSYHAAVILLCQAYGITHTLPASFPIQNNNEVWFDIVNEWIDKIQEMYDTLED